MSEEILCQNCGLPVRGSHEMVSGTEENPSCVRCTNPDGTPKTREEMKYGILSYFINERQLKPEEAKEAAKPYLEKL